MRWQNNQPLPVSIGRLVLRQGLHMCQHHQHRQLPAIFDETSVRLACVSTSDKSTRLALSLRRIHRVQIGNGLEYVHADLLNRFKDWIN